MTCWPVHDPGRWDEGPARVWIVGAGAIGASIGALLRDEEGVDCRFILDRSRSPHAAAIVATGVDLRFPSASRRVRFRCVPSLAAASPTPEDLVLIATMGQHTAAAVADLDVAVPVASFQNGLYPLRLLKNRPLIAAMVYVPAERRGPGIVALPGSPRPGSVVLGPWTPGDPRLAAWSTWLAARLSGAGFTAEADADIAPWIRAKVLTNLGGIVVALCDDPPMDVIAAACAEAEAVWTADGAPFRTVPELLARIGPLTTVPVDGLARLGGSTRSALARGDALETATLHGDVIADGRRLRVPTPVNKALVAIAARATAERWSPGAMSADALRDLVWRPGGQISKARA